MAYEKQTWDTTSFVNPTRMNHIEDGIEEASNGIGALETEVSELSETISQQIIAEDVTPTETTINGNFAINYNITKSGYSPLGIVGYHFIDRSVGGYIFITGLVILDKDNAVMYGRATKEYKIAPKIRVLYTKD